MTTPLLMVDRSAPHERQRTCVTISQRSVAVKRNTIVFGQHRFDSAALGALSTFMQGMFPSMEAVLAVVDFLLSIVLLGALFAAMYKVLPDTSIAWRDVAIGAVFATLLFAGGKYLITL